MMVVLTCMKEDYRAPALPISGDLTDQVDLGLKRAAFTPTFKT